MIGSDPECEIEQQLSEKHEGRDEIDSRMRQQIQNQGNDCVQAGADGLKRTDELGGANREGFALLFF